MKNYQYGCNLLSILLITLLTSHTSHAMKEAYNQFKNKDVNFFYDASHRKIESLKLINMKKRTKKQGQGNSDLNDADYWAKTFQYYCEQNKEKSNNNILQYFIKNPDLYDNKREIYHFDNEDGLFTAVQVALLKGNDEILSWLWEKTEPTIEDFCSPHFLQYTFMTKDEDMFKRSLKYFKDNKILINEKKIYAQWFSICSLHASYTCFEIRKH